MRCGLRVLMCFLVATLVCLVPAHAQASISGGDSAGSGGYGQFSEADGFRGFLAGGGDLDTLDKDRDQLIFFAVLEGLYTDGVADDVVSAIIPPYEESDGRHDMQVNFVYACSLCAPAFEAFRLYAHRPAFQHMKAPKPIKTFGGGLSDGERERLLSDDDAVRRPALETLIGKWLGRYVERLRLTDEERSNLVASMNKGRDAGMKYLPLANESPERNWDSCAICDAAAGACSVDALKSDEEPTD